MEYYYDLSADSNWLLEDDKIKLPFKKLIRNTVRNVGEYSQDWMLESVHSESYWIDLPLDKKNESLLVKCKLDLVRKEVIDVFGLFIGIAVLLFIPVIVLLLNVISRIITQRRMYRIFYQDTVTEGRNWMYFLHYTERFLTSFRSAAKTYAIIDLQLEKYRSFCACNGVAEGEKLLKDINRWISAAIGKKELCVRYAKSNFALMIACMDEQECKSRIHNLLYTLSNNTSNAHMVFHIGAYMVYPYRRPTNGRIARRKELDIPQYYNYACEARASIEEGEESAVAIFDQKMLDDQMWEHWVEQTMEKALINEEFVVYMQPKYNPINDVLVGAEALVRWISPEKSFIPPNRFIPIFEHNGFINKLDDYMVAHVAKEQSRWIKEGRTVVPISVNVSRMHFASENLAEHLCSLVDQYNTPHHLIEIELTESAFFDNKKTLLNTVKKLKEYGFELSMDDFGAGYSSLNSLKNLPLDVLKIDAEFFRGEDEKERGDIIVGEAIQLAKMLNMRTVVEGIETKEQIDFLADHGCDMIQGFYYAKPMPINEFEATAFAHCV